jgi:hypothetical protein
MAKESGIPKISTSMLKKKKNTPAQGAGVLFPECPALRALLDVKHHEKINFYYFSHHILSGCLPCIMVEEVKFWFSERSALCRALCQGEIPFDKVPEG